MHYLDFWAVNGEGYVQSFKLNGTSTLTRFGRLWQQIRARTTVGGSLQDTPNGRAYKGVRLGFANFQEFCEFLIAQPMWWDRDWQVDKDLLSTGTKVYSPSTCCLLPSELNSALKLPYKHEKPAAYYAAKKDTILALADKHRLNLRDEVYDALVNFVPKICVKKKLVGSPTLAHCLQA